MGNGQWATARRLQRSAAVAAALFGRLLHGHGLHGQRIRKQHTIRIWYAIVDVPDSINIREGEVGNKRAAHSNQLVRCSSKGD